MCLSVKRLMLVNDFQTQKDNHFFELHETKEKFNFIDTNIKYIDGTSFLLIGYIILYPKHEFNKNKYNCNIKYIDLTEAFIQYIGIGSRILKKVSSYNKTILFPYKPIEISCEFWIKYISKFVKFTTSDTLKIYCKSIGIEEWNHYVGIRYDEPIRWSKTSKMPK